VPEPIVNQQKIKMSDKKHKILEIIKNLTEARDIIFSQIVNLAMSGEMSCIESTFEIGEEYSFTLSHFEDVEDENVKKLVSLCKKTENTVFSLMNLNGITEKDINL
jgi:hypothetical protein